MRPLVHFLVLGACLFGLLHWRAWLAADDEARELRRPQQAAEVEARTDAELFDELLYREALVRGLGDDDPVVRARLVANMRFLHDRPGESDALYREALRLGLDRSDLVVRRRLIQRVRLAYEAEGRAVEPSDAELRSMRDRAPERYRTEARARLSQVFFDPARRGDAGAERAARAALEAAESAAGDPSLWPRELPLSSRRELAKLFGGAFADAVLALPVGPWSGPLRSAQGLHLVRVHERRAPEPLPFTAVREALRQAWLEEQAARALRRGLTELRQRYSRVAERAR